MHTNISNWHDRGNRESCGTKHSMHFARGVDLSWAKSFKWIRNNSSWRLAGHWCEAMKGLVGRRVPNKRFGRTSFAASPESYMTQPLKLSSSFNLRSDNSSAATFLRRLT